MGEADVETQAPVQSDKPQIDELPLGPGEKLFPPQEDTDLWDRVHREAPLWRRAVENVKRAFTGKSKKEES